MVRWVIGSILHGVDPLSYFSFQPVLHDWCTKSRGMCYLVCGMMHIKEPLLLIGKSSRCGGSGFSLSLSEWSFTICMTPYNRKKNVLSASLNKAFPSFLPSRRLEIVSRMQNIEHVNLLNVDLTDRYILEGLMRCSDRAGWDLHGSMEKDPLAR